MKQSKIEIIGMAILIGMTITGCSASTNVSNQVEHEAVQEGNTQDVGQYDLTISTFMNDNFLNEAVKAFNEAHPDTVIGVIPFQTVTDSGPGEAKGDTDPNHSLDNYITYLNTAFMSGEAPDMISLGWLPENKYIESGYLLNLSDLIAGDSDFTEENYYLNVIQNETYNDGIYCIPTTYSVKMTGMYKGVYDQLNLNDTLLKDDYWNFDTMQKVMAEVPDMKEKHIYLECTSGRALFSHIFDLEGAKFVNVKTKLTNFDSDEFISLLETCKQIEDDKLLYSEDEGEEQKCIFTGRFGSYVGALSQLEYATSDISTVLSRPLANSEGQIALSGSNRMAIANSTKHKDLCWQFMKFLLSEEMQTSPELSQGFVINKKAAEKKYKKSIEKVKDMLKDEGLEVSEDKLLNTLVEELDKWNKMESIPNFMTNEISHVVDEEVVAFFEGKSSAQDVAKALQNKVYVMLNE